MAAFDPELYLRLLGERDVAAGNYQQRSFGPTELSDAAAALAVAGAIDPQLAAEISADYQLAAALRRDPAQSMMVLRHFRRPDAGAEVEPIPARRIFSVAAVVPLGKGEMRVHSVTLTDEAARIAVTIRWDQPSTPQWHSGPSTLTVRAPDGQTFQARFSGGWGNGQASGQFETTRALPADPPWLELDGTRVELGEPTPAAAVKLEQFPGDRAPLRYLWQLMADFGNRRTPGSGVEPATEALLAAGLIDYGDPELEAIRWVNRERNGHRPRPRHLQAPQPGNSSAPPPGVPVEWRSLGLRAAAGPEGTIVIGAATPLFDGISAAVNLLRSGPDAFTLSVETRGVPHPHPRLDAAQRKLVAWWAYDDRANYYLGHINGWGGGGPKLHSRGEIEFARLDPKARELTLAITTLRARALIKLPLEWT